MRVLYIVLLFLAAIFAGAIRDRIGVEPLLQKRVSDVPLIPDDITNCPRMPTQKAFSADRLKGSFRFVEDFGNRLASVALQIQVKDSAYRFRFGLLYRKPSVLKPVAERCVRSEIFPARHALLNTPSGIAGDVLGFLLCMESGESQDHLRVELVGINPLFLEVNADTE